MSGIPIGQDTQTAAVSSLQLLRQIRDGMSARLPVQEKLDQLVVTIARGLQSDVCSVYLLRNADILELYASEGLNREAVHHASLRIGQGLVGDIAAHARPLNLADAERHPSFVFLRETGEERFHSFAGVPILKEGNVIGVLVVQHRLRTFLAPEAMEVLQTVAMVLAELLAHAGVIQDAEVLQASGEGLQARHLKGIGLAGGMRYGHAVLHVPVVHITHVVAETPHEELQRLEQALGSFQQQMDVLLSNDALEGESLEILQTYRMYAFDEGWQRRIREAIQTGLTAEAAISRVQNELCSRLYEGGSRYLRDRAHDIQEVSRQLISALHGEKLHFGQRELQDDAVLVARTLGPAELLAYDVNKLAGVVLEESPLTSHVAIVARSMNIPVIGNVTAATRYIHEGDALVVDADHAEVFVRPPEEVVQMARQAYQSQQQQLSVVVDDSPLYTADGVRVTVMMNAGLTMDAARINRCGAEGIGLYRTEVPYLASQSFPNVEAQYEIYRKVADAAGQKPVWFRTFDIGGDKPLYYFQHPNEANPAMGWRGIRIALDRPAILLRQLRALIWATGGRQLHLMAPFIADVSEFVEFRKLVERELERADRKGRMRPSHVSVGAMLEIPSLLWQLPELAEAADFISIGTNDLMQFLFAADRESPQLQGRFDPVHPAMYRLLGQVAQVMHQHATPVSCCGEMVSHRAGAMLALASGLSSLSVTPAAVAGLRQFIRHVHVGEVREFVKQAAAQGRLNRHSLQEYARDRGWSAVHAAS